MIVLEASRLNPDLIVMSAERFDCHPTRSTCPSCIEDANPLLDSFPGVVGVQLGKLKAVSVLWPIRSKPGAVTSEVDENHQPLAAARKSGHSLAAQGKRRRVKSG